MAGTTFLVLSKNQFRDFLNHLLEKHCRVAIGIDEAGIIEYLDSSNINKVLDNPRNHMAVKNATFASDEPTGKLYRQDGYVWHSFNNTKGEGHIMINSNYLQQAPADCVSVAASYPSFFVLCGGETKKFIDPPAALKTFYRALVRRQAKACVRVKDAVGNSVYVSKDVVEGWRGIIELLEEKGSIVLSDFMEKISRKNNADDVI